MHSYLRQIKKLQKFIAKVAEEGCWMGPDGTCAKFNLEQCLACEAEELLGPDVGPVVGKLMGTGEGYPQPVLALENPARRV